MRDKCPYSSSLSSLDWEHTWNRWIPHNDDRVKHRDFIKPERRTVYFTISNNHSYVI